MAPITPPLGSAHFDFRLSISPFNTNTFSGYSDCFVYHCRPWLSSYTWSFHKANISVIMSSIFATLPVPASGLSAAWADVSFIVAVSALIKTGFDDYRRRRHFLFILVDINTAAFHDAGTTARPFYPFHMTTRRFCNTRWIGCCRRVVWFLLAHLRLRYDAQDADASLIKYITHTSTQSSGIRRYYHSTAAYKIASREQHNSWNISSSSHMPTAISLRYLQCHGRYDCSPYFFSRRHFHFLFIEPRETATRPDVGCRRSLFSTKSKPFSAPIWRRAAHDIIA